VFAPLLPAHEHLARLACADLFLDTWPCNAHTTASEALWAGVPPVTVLGQTFAQRVAASLLHSAGLDELACRDSQHYLDTVLQLAGDMPRREQLRLQLVAQRRSNPLFDGVRFARDVEALYLRMWQRAVAGLPPEHLAAQAS
jgi:protein O-GlcNAc transferase